MMFNFFLEKFRENKEFALKVVLSAIEITCFVLIVVYSVLLIGALNAQQIYSYRELGINRYFLILTISSVLLLITPYFIKKLFVWVDEQAKVVNVNEMKKNFLAYAVEKTQIVVDELAQEYSVSKEQVKDYLLELMEVGILKGELRGTSTGVEVFTIDPNFVVTSPREHKIRFFETEIEDFLYPYERVSLTKLSKYFSLSKEMVEKLLRQKLQSHEIEGYVEENTFYRDWPDFVKEMARHYKKRQIKCPECSNLTEKNRPFCHWCGKRIMNQNENENLLDDED